VGTENLIYDIFLIAAIVAVGAASTAGFYTLVAVAFLRYTLWKNKK
jgi:hypothetical protein